MGTGRGQMMLVTGTKEEVAWQIFPAQFPSIHYFIKNGGFLQTTAMNPFKMLKATHLIDSLITGHWGHFSLFSNFFTSNPEY